MWETNGRQVQTHTAQGTQSGRQVGNKWETSSNSYGPRHPEWETSVEDKCRRQVGDKCKLMRPKAPRVGDKCKGQVGDKCKLMRPKAPRVGDKCGRQMEDKCKLMRPKAPRVRDKCERQVWETSVGDKCKLQSHAAQGTQSGRQV